MSKKTVFFLEVATSVACKLLPPHTNLQYLSERALKTPEIISN